MEFPRKEYWSGCHFLLQGIFPTQGWNLHLPHWPEDSLSLAPPEKLCAVLCLVTQLCPTLCDSMDCSLPGSSVHGDSTGKNIGVSCHAFLQGIFPTQGSKPGLLHCRQILYQLSHKGSPRILEWIASPFSSRSSQPRNRTGISCIAGRVFTN